MVKVVKREKVSKWDGGAKNTRGKDGFKVTDYFQALLYLLKFD